MFTPSTIISGGQTGVDRGALDAGIALGLLIGGYIPRGRRADDGRVPEHYPMIVLNDPGYRTRTWMNVAAADATLILARGRISGGTHETIVECARLQKLYYSVDLTWKEEAILWNIDQWMTTHRPKVLNVAGPRERKAPGIQAETTRILVRAFGGSASSPSTTNR